MFKLLICLVSVLILAEGWVKLTPFNDIRNFMAAIVVKKTHKCAGALITEVWVITTASCVTITRRKKIAASSLTVLLGLFSYKKSINQKLFFSNVTVNKIHLHPFYHGSAYYNNIAMLSLNSLVNTSRGLGYIDLPAHTMDQNQIKEKLRFEKCWHYNWQFFSGDNNQGTYLSVSYLPVSFEHSVKCSSQNETNLLCADAPEFDPCKHKYSGGSLTCGQTLYGITVTNVECPSRKTFFLRIDPYLEWISKLTVNDLHHWKRKVDEGESRRSALEESEYNEMEHLEDRINYPESAQLENIEARRGFEQYEDLYEYVTEPQIFERYIKNTEVVEVKVGMQKSIDGSLARCNRLSLGQFDLWIPFMICVSLIFKNLVQ